MELVHRLKSGWTLLKFIRVVLGVLILSSSVAEQHIPGMILGGLFLLIALFTDGVCCMAGNCYAPVKPADINETETIEYEELGTGK